MRKKTLNTKQSWSRALIGPSATLQEAAQNLSDSALRIALVVDQAQNRLLGTLSDGDIRRGLLRELSLTSTVAEVKNPSPLVVPEGISADLVRQIMAANKIHQVPEVTADGRVVALHTWEDFETAAVVDSLMVIMAGGKGTRLRPHTEDCPKPILQVHGKPMLLHIIERAKAEGFYRFVVSLNYLGHMIEGYFGDGQAFGVQIDYLRETIPLGTAGALSLFDAPPDLPFVVTNGDVLTDIRYADLLEFHNRYAADATMAVRLHEWQHPFGVVDTDGLRIVGFEEKPIARSHINAGVYAISPPALTQLVKGGGCDMPQLFEKLKESGGRIIAYPMHEPWLDVGRPDDLLAANTQN
jgi:dTDP-glucose pyrophosphorylase